MSVTLPRVGGAPNIALPSTAIFQKDGKPAVWVVIAGHARWNCARWQSSATTPIACYIAEWHAAPVNAW